MAKMLKKILLNALAVLSAVAVIALIYALVDSLVSGIWPQFNGVMVYRFAEFFPRSLSIYFLILLPLGLLGLPFYYISKRLPGLRDRDLNAVYNAVGATVSLIIPMLLFEIPYKLRLSYYEPIFVVADLLGMLLMAFITVYLAPLMLSFSNSNFPVFVVKTSKVAAYLSLGLVAITLFSLTVLPEITRPPYNPDAPNLLVISIDTLRKDHISYYGYDKIETPNIDAFLEGATTFDNAYCSSSWTLPSFASFLTGYQPSVCKVDTTRRMSDDMITIAEILEEEGYNTEAYCANGIMKPELGVARGFDIFLHWKELEPLLPFYGTRLYGYLRRIRFIIKPSSECQLVATEFNRKMTITALKNQGDRPFFIWCHFLDPHGSYVPPDRYLKGFSGTPQSKLIKLRDKYTRTKYEESDGDRRYIPLLYDGEIKYVDEQIGHILQALDDNGYRDNTVVLLFTDHGEEFWDHGEFGHGRTVYPELVDMVLGYRDPNVEHPLNESEKYVAHIDLKPTILDSLGIPWVEEIQGESFYSDLTEKRDYARSRVLSEYMGLGRIEVKGLRYNDYLYSIIPDTNESELYNLSDDPRAERNIIGDMSDTAALMDKMMDDMMADNEKLAAEFAGEREINLPDERLDELKALGYLDK
ncbi:MAG: sulfatase [bacterium]|nr:sulfatase [bacterium]